MSRFIIHTTATAPEASKHTIEIIEKTNGFVPNLIGVLSNAPAALKMYQDAGKINKSTSLSAAEIELIQITAAKVNECRFCVAGHTKIATIRQLFPHNVLAAVRSVSDFPDKDAKLNALARFTVAIMQHKGAVSDDDLATFFAAGYQHQQAIEVILGIALATLCNYTNNLAQTSINEQLQPYA